MGYPLAPALSFTSSPFSNLLSHSQFLQSKKLISLFPFRAKKYLILFCFYTPISPALSSSLLSLSHLSFFPSSFFPCIIFVHILCTHTHTHTHTHISVHSFPNKSTPAATRSINRGNEATQDLHARPSIRSSSGDFILLPIHSNVVPYIKYMVNGLHYSYSYTKLAENHFLSSLADLIPV